MRTNRNPSNHLGRAALATTVTGTLVSPLRYLPYGATRPDFAAGPFPTDRRCTGQREEVTLGVYDYGARLYAPGLGRFLSADTLVPEPGRPQAFNRYSYALNNPARYTDPSGHWYYDPGLDAVVHQHGANYNERPQYLYPIQTPQTSVYAKPQPQNLPSPAPVPAAAGPLLPYAATPGSGLGWPLGPYNSQPQSFPPQLKGHETVIEPSNGPSRPLGWQPQIARRPHLYLDLRKVNWVDVTISGAGLVGEAAKFCGIEGIVVYGLTEIAEVGGGINDLYTFASAAENGKTFSTIYTLGKMGIDLGELAPNYGLIFNLADLGLAIAPALSFEEEIICLNCQ